MKRIVVFTFVALSFFMLVSCKEKVEKALFDQQLKVNDSLRIELNSKQTLVDSLSVQVTELADKITAMKAAKPKATAKKKTTTKKKTKK